MHECAKININLSQTKTNNMKTNETTQVQTFCPNLFNAISTEEQKRTLEFFEKIEACNTIDDIKNNNWMRSYITPAMEKLSFTELKAKLIAKREKSTAKKLAKIADELNEVFNAPDFTTVKISVEWKRSQMWGSNPSCEAVVIGQGVYTSGSVGGCGYDKLSTAVAQSLNQSKSILKALYNYKEANGATKTNRDVFGYGSGYGILPSLEGGVGVSCYPDIFKTIGYKFQGVAHGKTFDAYLIEKI